MEWPFSWRYPCRLHPHLPSGECPFVRQLRDQLVGGAVAMRSLRLYTDKNGPVTALRLLQCCSELEGMARHHAVVVIRRRYQGGRIADSRLDVMQRRILDEILNCSGSEEEPYSGIQARPPVNLS